MGNRPRITRDRGEFVYDGLEYKANKATVGARNIVQLRDNIEFDVWYDKHYVYRNGEREGIEPPEVQALIGNALPHLVYYSSKIKNFVYLNENVPHGHRKQRIVLQDSYSGNVPLNVIVEVHFVSLHRQEITVITAIAKEDFEWSDGQYAIELTSKTNSVLKLKARGRYEEVAALDE